MMQSASMNWRQCGRARTGVQVILDARTSLEGAVMDGDKTEHVAEFVRVLERYCVAIGVQTFAALKDWQEERTDPVLRAFAKYASVPIIKWSLRCIIPASRSRT